MTARKGPPRLDGRQWGPNLRKIRPVGIFPRASEEEVQPVVTTTLGPRRLNRMESSLERLPGVALGTA